jgi:hypothetical protein
MQLNYLRFKSFSALFFFINKIIGYVSLIRHITNVKIM